MGYEDLPDAVLVTDPQGTVLAANSAAARLLGTAPQVGDRLPTLTDETGRDWWACQSRARQLPGVRGVPERELRCGPVSVLLTARYLRTADGALCRVVLVLRSTAARRRAERASAELVSTVAHELRSPLTSVKGFSATMLAKWDRFTDEQKRQMLEWINADADRVTRLLAELLDVSRIDAGRLELHRQVVDLAELTRRTFAGRIAAGEAPERFALADGGGSPELWLDPDKMDQVLGNLIENALRHGAGQVRVSIDATTDPPGVQVCVDDEGDGVPVALRGQVFTKFFRGNARRGGTGLGLYIVQGLIEAHGGQISVEAAPSGGARFRFRLPAGTPSYLG